MEDSSWKKALDGALSKLEVSEMPERGVITQEGYKSAINVVSEKIDQDSEALQKSHATLFANHAESFEGENGQKLANLFEDWRDGDNPPSVPAILLDAADKMGIDKDDPIFQAALMTGIAAEITLDNAYHDNNHFREVVTATMRLVNTNNELATSGQEGVHLMDGQDISKILLAAAGHDLNHDGDGNAPNGVHQQYLLEQGAIDTMLPFMEAAGMDAQDIKDVGTMIRVTDVSAPRDGKSPHTYMKETAKTTQDGGVVPAVSLPPELKDLAINPTLLQSATMLSDADLSPSAAATYEFNQRMTVLMNKEVPAIKVGAGTTKFFCSVVVGGEFSSVAGRAQSQSSLKGMINQADKMLQKQTLDQNMSSKNKVEAKKAPPAQKIK